MGSKVSGKMAAASRVVQVVRPHAPLIKFPDRKGIPKPNVEDALKVITASLPKIFPSTPPPSASVVSNPPPRPPEPLSRLPGTPDSAATIQDLPRRYRRRTLELDEINYIQVIAQPSTSLFISCPEGDQNDQRIIPADSCRWNLLADIFQIKEGA
ncbi:hypothetical protein DNTS_021983 [Danionella cerebrum]|uniref:28S ribosomal protein S36, mitochondrial n=1 Tax=Danionella cerebrum TaxID=2873325 RepID=A0A553QG57_9TELE|nr:hypothetical protein DNTS_021983 [Danionella translucida]